MASSKSGWKGKLQQPAKASFDSKKDYYVLFKTTFGDITVQLHPDVAPQHSTCFINLAEIGYYDDVVFHRIIKQFKPHLFFDDKRANADLGSTAAPSVHVPFGVLNGR